MKKNKHIPALYPLLLSSTFSSWHQQQLLGKQSYVADVQIWSSKALPWLCLGAMEVELAGPAAAYRRGKTMEVGMGSPGVRGKEKAGWQIEIN